MARGGPSTKRLSDAEREKIADAIQSGEACNAIARKFKRSPGTVSKIAKDFGLTFERSQTKRATEAKRADNENRFETLKERLLDEAERGLEELHAPAMSMKWDDGVLIQQQIDEPTFTDKRHIAFRINGFIQYALAIEHRTQGDDDTSRSDINEWMSSVREEAERRAASE